MQNSIYAVMIQIGNLEQMDRMEFMHSSESCLRRFCDQLEDEHLLSGTPEANLERMLAKEGKRKTFKTRGGAECSFNNSLVILARYASSLRYDLGSAAFADLGFELGIRGQMFTYRAVLPPESRYQGLHGAPYRNKTLAKRSAAWETVRMLRGMHLLSLIARQGTNDNV